MREITAISDYKKYNKLVGAGQLKNTYYVLRHGQSIINVPPVFCTTLDSDKAAPSGLTHTGKVQAKAAGRQFEDTGVLAKDIVIYTSPFTRAKETAGLFAAELGEQVELHIDTRLRERFGGNFEGTAISRESLDQIERPDQLDPFNHRENVESPMEVTFRVTDLVQETESRHTGKTIIFVSHWHTMAMLLNAFEGCWPGQTRIINNAELHSLQLASYIAQLDEFTLRKPTTVMMLGSTPGYVQDAIVQPTESVQCAQESLMKRHDGIDYRIYPGKVVYSRKYCPQGGESVAVIVSHAKPSLVRVVAEYLRQEQKQSLITVATYNGGGDAKHRTRAYQAIVFGKSLDEVALTWQKNAEDMQQGDLYATCAFYTTLDCAGVCIQSECNPDKSYRNSPEQILAWEELCTRVAQKTAEDLGVTIKLTYYHVNLTGLYDKPQAFNPVDVTQRPDLFNHHKAADPGREFQTTTELLVRLYQEKLIEDEARQREATSGSSNAYPSSTRTQRVNYLGVLEHTLWGHYQRVEDEHRTQRWLAEGKSLDVVVYNAPSI